MSGSLGPLFGQPQNTPIPGIQATTPGAFTVFYITVMPDETTRVRTTEQMKQDRAAGARVWTINAVQVGF